MAGLWFGLSNSQNQKLENLTGRKAAATKKFDQVQRAMDNAQALRTQLAKERAELDHLEADMATGDLNSWAFNTIRDFKKPYKVEIPQFGQIDGPRNTIMLPKFPYQQATVTVAGSAQFYDLGRFVSDFENRFPFFRIANLSLEPTPANATGDPERLAFKMEVVALVKPKS
jgi:hypothetical protein